MKIFENYASHEFHDESNGNSAWTFSTNPDKKSANKAAFR